MSPGTITHDWLLITSLYTSFFGEGNGTPLQYSRLENPMGGGAWWAAVHGVAMSRIQLSDFTFPSHFHALEKEMATHSSVLAWRIPGTGEPGGLPSMGSHRVGHDWSDLAAAAAVNRYRFYCWADGNALAIDSGAGCTKLWIYWNSLTCTLKSGGLHYVKYVNSNNKKEKNY